MLVVAKLSFYTHTKKTKFLFKKYDTEIMHYVTRKNASTMQGTAWQNGSGALLPSHMVPKTREDNLTQEPCLRKREHEEVHVDERKEEKDMREEKKTSTLLWQRKQRYQFSYIHTLSQSTSPFSVTVIRLFSSSKFLRKKVLRKNFLSTLNWTKFFYKSRVSLRLPVKSKRLALSEATTRTKKCGKQR